MNALDFSSQCDPSVHIESYDISQYKPSLHLWVHIRFMWIVLFSCDLTCRLIYL